MMMAMSDNEYLIMVAMWRSETPLSRSGILKATEGRNWNPASIHLILNSMLSKGIIKVTDENVKYGRTYEPTISYEDYLLAVLKKHFPDKTEKELLKDCTKMLRKRK